VSLDFATYRPPGTYIEETQSPVTSRVGTAPTLVALVGPSVGYRTYSETVTLTDTTPVALTKLGGITGSVKVTSLDGSTIYQLATDYAVAATLGADNNAQTLTDNGMTIARISDGAIANPGAVRVSYHYADSTYYDAVRVEDFELVKDLYGEPFDPSTGVITSPLSMAASIAFNNGARELVLVATAGTTTVTSAQLAAAYPKIANLHEVGIVVPVTAGVSVGSDLITVANDLVNHCNQSSDGGFFRIGIMGADNGYSGDPTTISVAANSARCMVAWPNKLLYYNVFSAQAVEVGGQYLAAAYAGRLASLNVQEGLTRKGISGFAGIASSALQTMSRSSKDSWSNGGVAVTELTRQNTLIVRHGTSTNTSTTAAREVSVTRAKDRMVQLIQDSIDSAQLVGSPITSTSVVQVKSIVQGALEACKDAGTIIDYTALAGRMKPGDPQVVEIKFQYKPAWPLNYVLVSFSIDTTTGSTDFSAGTTVG